MSHWNYRVVHVIDKAGESYAIVEAHYDDDEKLSLYSYPEPSGSTLTELRNDLGLMLNALDKPVIEEADLPDFKKWW